MAELSWDSVVDALNTNHIPEIFLLLMGITALAIVWYYKADKESTLYKVLVIAGVVMGAFMVYVALAVETGWDKGTLYILTLASFTLIVRPFKDVNIAAIIGLIVAIWVYLLLPDAVADIQPPFDFIKPIGDGVPRIIVSIVAGGFVYMVLQFIQAVVMLFGKIFNAWPFLMIIGIWCIVESIALLAGHTSTWDWIMTIIDDARGSSSS